LNINVSIPLTSAILYLFLIIISLFVLSSEKGKYSFIGYLAATMCWSLASFLSHGNYFPRQSILVQEFIVATGFIVPIAYFYFISDYTSHSSSILQILSVIVAAAIMVIDFCGLVVKNSTVIDNLLIYQVSLFFYLFFIAAFFFVGVSIYYLSRRLGNSQQSKERRQVICLYSGLGIVLLSSLNLFWTQSQKYPIEHAGNIVNVAILAYVLLKYRLFEIRLPVLIEKILRV
jgi:hypothetical protein